MPSAEGMVYTVSAALTRPVIAVMVYGTKGALIAASVAARTATQPICADLNPRAVPADARGL